MLISEGLYYDLLIIISTLYSCRFLTRLVLQSSLTHVRRTDSAQIWTNYVSGRIYLKRTFLTNWRAVEDVNVTRRQFSIPRGMFNSLFCEKQLAIFLLLNFYNCLFNKSESIFRFLSGRRKKLRWEREFSVASKRLTTHQIRGSTLFEKLFKENIFLHIETKQTQILRTKSKMI